MRSAVGESRAGFFHDCADITDKKTFATDEHRFSQISEKKRVWRFLYLCSSVLICGEKNQGIAGRIACVTFRFCINMTQLRCCGSQPLDDCVHCTADALDAKHVQNAGTTLLDFLAFAAPKFLRQTEKENRHNDGSERGHDGKNFQEQRKRIVGGPVRKAERHR